jgi:methyl coenzyme M reductase subunit D
VVTLGNGRQVIYGPCYRPASIDHGGASGGRVRPARGAPCLLKVHQLELRVMVGGVSWTLFELKFLAHLASR